MSQRQRRRDQRRKQAQKRGPGKLATAGGLTAGATLAFAGVAHADTFTVNNLNDSGAGSLRQAIKDANNNGNGSTVDNVVFASGLSGTINVGTDSNYGLYPETAMNIQGPGADKITLRGNPSVVDYVVYASICCFDSAPGDPITISGLTITGGNATGHHFFDSGGGIYTDNDTSLTISGSVITGNHADSYGGGIFFGSSSGSLTLNNTTVSGNNLNSGAYNYYGGGIFSAAPTVIRNSTISGNTGGSDGPGVYMTDSPSLTIENTTIANNITTGNGGDIEGGGVWITGGTLDIKSSTITGNSVGGSKAEGGGVYTDIPASDVNIRNTIIANNHGLDGNDLFLRQGGQIGFSLIKDPSSSGTPFDSTGPNVTGLDPQLGGLANNGGPTQTEAPSSTSPVLDKGNAFGLTSDQRGVLRPIDFPAIANAPGGDGSDVGAVELQPDNNIKLGKLKRNQNNGTAKQIVLVPLPDAGTLTIKGKGLKTKTTNVHDNGKVKLKVIPKGSKKGQLNSSGVAKIKAKITYSPTGNLAKTLKRKLKLLKR